MAIEVNSANYDEIIGSDKPVVIDFWATWCGPCKAIAPYIEELAVEFEGKAIVGKVNVDENSDISAKYGVRNIPTVIFVKNGKVVDKQIGATSKAALKSKLEALL
jgi:thioredoxin 1